MLASVDDDNGEDLCRVCRSEGLPERPLFHPCICTGSIKWIHQECLVQWMRYSKKEYCELCRYKFSFTPIYAPDMPKRLPVTDLVGGLFSGVVVSFRSWLHYTMVALAWCAIVPLIAARTFRSLFAGSFDSVINLPVVMFSVDNIPYDIFHGSIIVTCTLLAFIGLVWLREQIISGGGPDWLVMEEQDVGRNAVNDQPHAAEIENGDQQIGLEEALNADIPQQNVPQAAAQPAAEEHNNWNPVDWDRAEELTWERLLGLDGSLVFLEHVFWVISLNALFALVFAFFPHLVGYYVLSITRCEKYAKMSHFEGLVTAFVGYILIGFLLISLYALSGYMRYFSKIRRSIGLSYVVVKVTFLLAIEIGLLPLICGWWLDICSLDAFNILFSDRQKLFLASPGICMFVHWLAGMVFVYYFASFILLLREIVRPGVLWFLRNLNDPDFSPIQDMINLPLLRHIRRLLASAVIFGATIMCTIWAPIKILNLIWPNFLPFVINDYSESVNELSLELLILQIVMPALLEHSYVRDWVRGFIRTWCQVVAWILDLKSFLLGTEETQRQQEEENRRPVVVENEQNLPPLGAGLGAAHQALLQRAGPTGFEPYVKPKYFALRILVLLFIMVYSIVICSLGVFIIPVYIGRKLMCYWPVVQVHRFDSLQIHEIYTAAIGTYICWLTLRLITILKNWIVTGKKALAKKFWKSTVIVFKTLVLCFWLMGVIPLAFGLLFELMLLTPLRIPVNQTPILWIWQDWALGVLYCKILAALILMGPECRLRRALDRVFRNGVRRISVKHALKEIVVPILRAISLLIAVPYIFADQIVPIFVQSFELRNSIGKRVYPTIMLTTMAVFMVKAEFKQIRHLYESIKNDKYLVGKRLVNYNHKK